MSTRHMRRPAGAVRTTYIRSAQSGSIGGRSGIGEHRLPPTAVPRFLLWMLAASIAFALVNLAARYFGYL
ncbi:hypothetical protein [Ralstonia solanacearum]|uniref:Transmembrane protein n=1 Tax=Ralstonia solanacearum TaxID=305 RepID=A0AAD0SDS6_RALSL|nr:hypothetical protein [Ralstonia solanacearum]AXV81382.1 hypothetical protein CJO77_07330 [Ralstonia solanacearum]AXW52517.1 hypothetical protein CJO92_07325 [Ralstonia solanacearum]